MRIGWVRFVSQSFSCHILDVRFRFRIGVAVTFSSYLCFAIEMSATSESLLLNTHEYEPWEFKHRLLTQMLDPDLIVRYWLTLSACSFQTNFQQLGGLHYSGSTKTCAFIDL